MGFYEDMQAIATGVLTQFKTGKVEYLPISRVGGTIDEPGAPASVTKITIPGATVTGVSNQYVDGSDVISTDLQCVASVIPGGYDIRGMIFADDVQLKIIKILPKPAAGTPVAIVLILRS